MAQRIAVPTKKTTSGGNAGAAKMKLVVKCTANQDDIGMGTLVGTYMEVGSNHGKKTFKRLKQPGEDTIYIFWWDSRDGEEQQGWWFGDEVGGSQVWSRCEKASPMPPKSGWRIPWDGGVQNNLVVTPDSVGPATAKTLMGVKQERVKSEAFDHGDGGGSSNLTPAARAAVDERSQRATDKVVIAEVEASQALESARAMLEGEVDDEAVKVVEELLHAQQSAITDAHKELAAEVMDARKKAPTAVALLTKLTPRLRSVQSSIARQLNEAKVALAKKRREDEEQSKKDDATAEKRQAAESDVKKLEQVLPEAQSIVDKAEATLNDVYLAAKPLATEFGAEMSETVVKALRDTEAAATKSQAAIQAARKQVAQHTTAARQWAPEARKVAIAEFSSLQERLSEVARKLAPYLRVRKEYDQKVETKKVLTEVAQKLASVELEVEKVTGVLVAPEKSEELIKNAEASLMPAMKSLASAMRFVEQRLEKAQGSLKTDLLQMQARGNESKQKLEEFHVKLKGFSEQVQHHLMLRRALEKVEKAEKMLEATSEAELPFLQGDVEAVPGQEAEKAVTTCEKAVQAAEAATTQAKGFLKSKMEEVQNYPADAKESTEAEMVEMQNRVEAVAQQLTASKRETAQRRTAIQLYEVKAKTIDTEAKVKAVTEAGQPLTVGKIEEIPITTLKETVDKILAAEKVAAVAVVQATKLSKVKQGAGSSQTYATELALLQSRLTDAQQELKKQRKAALQAEKVWKARQLLSDREGTLKEVDQDVDKAEILTTPLGDEEPSVEQVTVMIAAVDAVQEKLTNVFKALEAAQDSALGDLSAGLSKLLSRCAGYQERIDEMKATTKDTRELSQVAAVMKLGKEQLAKVFAALKKADDAEMPYLKGAESLPLEQAQPAVEESEVAAKEVQMAVSETRRLLTSGSLQLRQLLPEIAKRGLQQIGELSNKNESAVERLNKLKKDTAARKSVMLRQKADAIVTEAEEAVQKTILASTPMATIDLDKATPEEATALCTKLGDAEKQAVAKLAEARRCILETQRMNQEADLKGLQSRLANVEVDLAKAKATSSEQEQKFVSKMLLNQTADMLVSLELEYSRAVEAAKPFNEGGERFEVKDKEKNRLVCIHGISITDKFELDSATTVCKLAIDDVVDGLEEARSDASGMMRRKVRVVQGDTKGKDGWVTMQGNQGKKYLSPYSPFVAFTKQLDKTVGEARKAAVSTMNFVNSKFAELSDYKKGALADAKAELVKFRPKVSAVQGKIDELRKKIDEGKKDHAKKEDAKRQAREDEVDKKASSLVLQAITTTVDKVKSEFASLKNVAQPLTSLDEAALVSFAKPLTTRKKIEEAAKVVASAATEARGSLKAHEGKVARVSQGPWLAARDEMLKQRQLLDTMDKESQALIGQAQSACDNLAALKSAQVSAALRTSAQKRGLTSEALWSEVAGKSDNASEATLAKYFKKLGKEADLQVLEEQMKLLLAKHQGPHGDATAGLSRWMFMRMLQRFYKCVKDIAITEEFDIKTTPTIKKLEATEVLEILEGPKTDSEIGVTRVRAKAMSDGQTGWVTVRGNQGTPFLTETSKPYHVVTEEISMQEAFASEGGKDTALLQPHEVLEVLEGPKKEVAGTPSRAKGKAVKDEKVGWFTVRNKQGQECAKIGNVIYTCKSSIALTSTQDIDSCEVLRKISKNEKLIGLEAPVVPSADGAIRLKARAPKDGLEGWVTLKGTAGTVFVEESGHQYVVTKSVPLQTEYDNNSDTVRTVEQGELFDIVEGPREDKVEPTSRIRVRAASSGLVGWTTLRRRSMLPWSSTYRCVAATDIADGLATDSSKTLRRIEVGEVLQMLEGPKSDASGSMRVKLAAKDGVVGWVTAIAPKGKPNLLCGVIA